MEHQFIFCEKNGVDELIFKCSNCDLYKINESSYGPETYWVKIKDLNKYFRDSIPACSDILLKTIIE